ncbi:GNAT family N-acetyltransferase [Sphingomonas quercus]|uniref:GNAT family N-acetyltransferase n=1 Tax=Sphingomonas quercus TaxID=2842451 RepID=A0ABS6BM40_9SPHN|nr:GNAT family N-acetyltransferase [Sphingomonas quercus]MBU3078836.1 GNAT family N-acetyltransferase [Sphingomonas quercus]
MLIEDRRILLRDFTEADRPAFLAYQLDPRYLALYDFDASDVRRPNDLFDLFTRWSGEMPRRNFQLGIFDRRTGALCGCGGIRKGADGTGVLGIELAPAKWGCFALALDAAAALADFGFSELRLETILGDTASGNKRVARLARWFGADIVAERDGTPWMVQRGWREVDWAISRQAWEDSRQRNNRFRRRSSSAHLR